MRHDVEVDEASLAEALRLLGATLTRRLAERGRGSFISPSECLGEVQLELRQVEQAMQMKEPSRISEELLDVAVGCVFGVASMKAAVAASKQAENKPAEVKKTT